MGAAVVFYFLIHLGLSRWSEHKISMAFSMPVHGFYYIPVEPITMAEHRSLQALNEVLKITFYPCKKIDGFLFDGPEYAYPPLLGLSDSSAKK